MLGASWGLKGFLCGAAVCAGLSFSLGAVADVYVADGQRGANGSLYKVDVNTGELTTIAPLAEAIHAMTFAADSETLYALTNTWRSGPGGNGKVVTINLTTGAFTDVTTSTPDRFTGLAFHQADGFLYALDNDRDLYRIDPETGATTRLFDISGSRRGLASDGTTLFQSTGNQLKSVSTTTDSQTTIGSFNVSYDRAIKDLTFDTVTNSLLGIDRSGGIYSINKDTGAATLLSDTAGNRIAIAAQPFRDDDLDGMNDFWEIFYGLNPFIDDSAFDLDGDGLTNLQEYQVLSNPTKPDTDGDGLSDSVEFDLGTSLTLVDTDDDGKSDYFEVLFGLNPLADDRILAIGTTVGTSDNAAVATDENGNVHVVYNHRVLSEKGSSDEIFYTMLSPEGELLIGSTLISNDDGLRSKMPDVTVLNGKVYVVWQSRQDDRENPPEVEFVALDPSLVPHNGSSADPGTLRIIEQPIIISPIDSIKSNHARIAVGKNNKLHVVFEDGHTEGESIDSIHYVKLNTDGSIISDTTLTSVANLRRAFPDLAIDSQNKVHVTWRASNGEGGTVWYGLINGNDGEVLIDSSLIKNNAGSPTISIDSNNVANLVYGVTNDSIRMIRINPALDDMDGSATNLETITVSPETLLINESDGLDSRPRHPFARMDENDNMLVSYLVDSNQGSGNVKFFTVSAEGTTSTGTALIPNSANRFEQLKISRDAEILVVATDNEVNLFKNLKSGLTGGASVSGGILQIVDYTEDDLPDGAKSGAPTAHDDHFFSMLITLPEGETVTVTLPTTLRLEEDSTFEVWTEATGWTEFDVPNLAEVTVELTDGGPGDADGVANGFIVINALALVSSNGGSFIQDFLDAGASLFEDDENGNGTSSGSVGGILLTLILINGLFSVARRRKSLH